MKKVLKWLSLLFAVSVAFFVIFFVYTINTEVPIKKPAPFVLQSQQKEQKGEALWLNHFVKREKKGYFFPVDEAYIKMDLVRYKPKKKPFELVVDDLDPYQLFCLNQELKRHKLRYFFKKANGEIKLLVYSQDKRKLHDLVKVLKNYQIEAKIKN